MTACPICPCAETTAFHVKDSRALLICRDCRHIFWARMPDLAEIAAYYGSVYAGEYGQRDVQAAHQDYYRGHAQELAALCGVPIGRMALADVGCSYPVFVHEALKAGAAVALGVDWSDDARADGVRRGVPVLTPDEFETTIPDGFLDVLRYSHTLEHMIDPVAMLRRHAAKVRPNGLIYVTQPNFPVLGFGASAVEPHDATFPAHLHFFSPLSFLRMAESAGLIVERYFSVTDPELGEARYAAQLDRAHAERMLGGLRDRGEDVRGPLNNFPLYTGLDGTAHLRKPMVAPPPPPDRLTRLRAAWPMPEDPGPPSDPRTDVLTVIEALNRRATGADTPGAPVSRSFQPA